LEYANAQSGYIFDCPGKYCVVVVFFCLFVFFALPDRLLRFMTSKLIWQAHSPCSRADDCT